MAVTMWSLLNHLFMEQSRGRGGRAGAWPRCRQNAGSGVKNAALCPASTRSFLSSSLFLPRCSLAAITQLHAVRECLSTGVRIYPSHMAIASCLLESQQLAGLCRPVGQVSGNAVAGRLEGVCAPVHALLWPLATSAILSQLSLPPRCTASTCPTTMQQLSPLRARRWRRRSRCGSLSTPWPAILPSCRTCRWRHTWRRKSRWRRSRWTCGGPSGATRLRRMRWLCGRCLLTVTRKMPSARLVGGREEEG